jgi:hypothetical protein
VDSGKEVGQLEVDSDSVQGQLEANMDGKKLEQVLEVDSGNGDESNKSEQRTLREAEVYDLEQFDDELETLEAASCDSGQKALDAEELREDMGVTTTSRKIVFDEAKSCTAQLNAAESGDDAKLGQETPYTKWRRAQNERASLAHCAHAERGQSEPRAMDDVQPAADMRRTKRRVHFASQVEFTGVESDLAAAVSADSDDGAALGTDAELEAEELLPWQLFAGESIAESMRRQALEQREAVQIKRAQEVERRRAAALVLRDEQAHSWYIQPSTKSRKKRDLPQARGTRG